MLRFQFLIKMKIAFVILYSSVPINLMTLKASAHSMLQKKGNIQKALSTQLSGFVVHKLRFVFVSTVVDKFISLI